MKYYTVYKTTNLINGKFYIGTHKTSDPNDNYLGSGKILKAAIEKYGVDSFKKEVMFVFDNPSDMFAKEAEIVTADFLAEHNTYNLKLGGEGGFDYLNSEGYSNPTHTSEHVKRMHEAGKEARLRALKAKWSDEEFLTAHRAACSKRMLDAYNSGDRPRKAPWLGKSHSDETKQKISIANSVSQRGERNSQYGTMWITNGIVNQKIKTTSPIPEGFRRGRIRKQESGYGPTR